MIVGYARVFDGKFSHIFGALAEFEREVIWERATTWLLEKLSILVYLRARAF